MKRILFIITLFTCGLFSQAQNPIPSDSTFPVKQSVANAPTTLGLTNVMQAKKGFINGVFPDTTTANLYNTTTGGYRLKYYPGAQIFTTSDSALWLRNSTATRWMRSSSGAGSIVSFNFITDSSLIICYQSGCDTIPMYNFYDIITNIVQNFTDSSIYNINDSTILICVGQGAERVCDTIHLGNSYTYYFTTGGDSVITCDTLETICINDSCYTQQLCDTIPISRVLVTIYQNGVRKLPNSTIVEMGGNVPGNTQADLLHDTYIFTDPYTLYVTGRPPREPVLGIRQGQPVGLSASIMSANNIGSADASYSDYNNAVNLYLNYTSKFIGDTTGYMRDRIGYMWMTNSKGAAAYYSLDDASAKQTGIMFHTLDTDNTDAVTIFGNQVPSAYSFFSNPPYDSTLLTARIAVFKTNGITQLPPYGVGDYTAGTVAYISAWDADGNFMEYPPGGLTPGSGLLFARDDARNNSGIDMYFSNAAQDMVWDSVGIFTIGIDPLNTTPYLYLDMSTTDFAIGDFFGSANGTAWVGKDNANHIYGTVMINGGSGARVFDAIGDTVTIGDVGNFQNNSIFQIDDGNQTQRIFRSRFEVTEATDVIAANDLTLSANGNAITITGNTQINAITTTNWQEGSVVELHLTGTPTLKNNTAGGAGTAPLRLAGATDFVITGYTVLQLQYKDGFWNEVGRTQAAGAGITGITADNGLTASTATNVQLFGPVGTPATLLNSRYLDATSLYQLFITGSIANSIFNVTNSGSGGSGVKGIAQNAGIGVWGESTGGTGVYGQTTDANGVYGAATTSGVGVRANAETGYALLAQSQSYVGAQIRSNYSTTNDVQTVLEINRQTTGGGGAGATGIGSSIDFVTATTTIGGVSNQIKSFWADATHLTRTSQLDITGVNSAATQTIMSAYGTGVVGIGISSGYTSSRLQVVDNAASAHLVDVTSNSTAAAGGNHVAINAEISGANANSGQGSVAVRGVNTHTGTTSTNYAASFGASGGSINIGVSASITGTGNSAAFYGTNAAAGYVAWFAATTTGTAVFADAANGTAVRGTTTGGTGLDILSSSALGASIISGAQLGLRLKGSSASNNTIAPILEISRLVDGGASVGANGVGGSIDLISALTTGDATVNQITWHMTDATAATRTSTLTLKGVLSAATVSLATFNGDGSWDIRPITATAASAITPAEGKFVFVSNTNGTFTSIGIWCYQNGAWKAL